MTFIEERLGKATGLLHYAPQAVIFLALLHPFIVWPLLGATHRPDLEMYMPPVEHGSGALNKIYFPILVAAGLALIVLEPQSRLRGASRAGLLLIAGSVGLAIISTLWSVEPAATLKRALLLAFIVTALALPAALVRSTTQIYTALLLVLGIAALANVPAVLLLPPGPIGHEGIYLHKNEFGLVAGLMLVMGVLRGVSTQGLQRLAAIALAVLAIGFLIVSRSKTSLGLALVVPMLAASVMISARWLRLSPAFVVPAALFGAWLVYEMGQPTLWRDFHAISEALVGDPTFTRRTDIWAFAFDRGLDRPLLGHGYGAFWGAGPNSPNLVSGEGFLRIVAHAHNGYLQSFVELGLVGFLLIVATLLVALHNAGRQAIQDARGAVEQISILVWLVLYSLLEVSWLTDYSAASMLFVLAVARAR